MIYIFIFSLMILFSKSAFAYIDPGIMTIVWQSVLLIFASIGAGIGIFYNKIKNFFSFFKRNKELDKKNNK